MSESSPEKSYKLSSLDQLRKLLQENGWTETKIVGLFGGIDGVNDPFKERELSETQLKDLAKKLESLKTKYEQRLVLNQFALGTLIDQIGITYSFANTDELCRAIEEQGVSYPRDYLHQAGSTFVSGFGAPRHLTKERFDTLIIELKKIPGSTTTDGANRGVLIHAAFGNKPQGTSQIPQEIAIEGETLKKLKQALEQEISSPVTVESLSKLLGKLEAEKNPDSRKVIVSYLWSKLASAGYIMTIQGGKPSLQHTADQKNAEVLEATLSAHLSKGILTIGELQRAVLIGSGSFGLYLDTQKVDLSNISTEKYALFLADTLKIDISKGNPAQKIATINKSSATPDEKAFLISYVSGGFSGYNLAPDAKRQMEIRAASQDLISSPQYTSTVARVETVSGGAVARERAQMQARGKEEELTIESVMNNPLQAITRYPWTSLTLLIGGIWKFGFMKTIGGVLLGMIGIKAVNELGNTELGKQVKDGLTKGAKGAVSAVTEALPSGSTGTPAPAPTGALANGPANGPVLTPSQQGLRNVIMQNATLNAEIDKLAANKSSKFTGKLDDYVKFIEADLKDIPLKTLFPSDHKESIFFDTFTTSLPGKPELSAKMLKKVLREYLTGTSTLTGTGDKAGEAEKEAFLKLYNITPADIQSKNLSQILESVHKVRTGGVAPAPAPAAATVITPAAPATPAVAPTVQKNTFKIGGVDKVPGNNVETSVNAPTFDLNGNPYKNASTRLKTDTSGVVFAPTGSIVKLGASVIQRQGVEHVEVEYAGEKVYIAITHLKP